MKAKIEVEGLKAGEYRVTVTEGDSRISYAVTVKPAYAAELAGRKANAEDLLHRSFEFLLEREPKESILREFDLTVIRHFFPEYEEEIRSRLAK